VLTGVPIIFPSSGGASITLPVVRGDYCLVFFLDRDISNWLINGSQKPSSRREHSLNDAVAIVGLNPFNKASKAKNNTDVLISFNGSEIALKPNGKIDIHSSNELNIKAENIVVNCTNANIKASSRINTQTPNFVQKGKMKIEGDIEITGRSLLKGNVKCDATIEGRVVKTSAGINLATHKHSYKEAQSGSNPTVVIPSLTGAGS
jgi:phage baseplate assembly protein gpV